MGGSAGGGAVSVDYRCREFAKVLIDRRGELHLSCQACGMAVNLGASPTAATLASALDTHRLAAGQPS